MVRPPKLKPTLCFVGLGVASLEIYVAGNSAMAKIGGAWGHTGAQYGKLDQAVLLTRPCTNYFQIFEFCWWTSRTL